MGRGLLAQGHGGPRGDLQFGRVQVGLLLSLLNVFLEANSLVAEPVGDLKDIHGRQVEEGEE